MFTCDEQSRANDTQTHTKLENDLTTVNELLENVIVNTIFPLEDRLIQFNQSQLQKAEYIEQVCLTFITNCHHYLSVPLLSCENLTSLVFPYLFPSIRFFSFSRLSSPFFSFLLHSFSFFLFLCPLCLFLNVTVVFISNYVAKLSFLICFREVVCWFSH